MKTEKEFSDFFVDSCRHTEKHSDLVAAVSKTYWSDLTTHLTGYFSFESRMAITQKAAEALSFNLDAPNSQTPWADVIRSFVRENAWGNPTITKKPKVKKTEEQEIFWHLFKYIWAFFQSMFIFKTVIFFFGLETAEHPDQLSIGWMWLFLSISFGSSAFFAYRNRHDQG